jgi:hypothetical protein
MDDIFRPISNKKEESSIFMYYTVFGDHDFIDEDNNPRVKNKKDALAYVKTDEYDRDYFYIKVGTYGKIFNPIGMYSEGKSNKFLAKIGKSEYTFNKVNTKVFDMYMNFLKTKNLAWLNNAEREMT